MGRRPTEENTSATLTKLQTEENKAYGKLIEATPTSDYDYVRSSELPVTAGLPISQNPAYGKVSTRAEDDKDYYVGEKMSGAEVGRTINEAYGTSRQSKSDNPTSTENDTHQHL